MLNNFIKLAATAMVLMIATLTAQAQVDTQAPAVVYRPAATGGPAGELQTFVARVSDESGLGSVALFYRQDPAAAYQRIEMRRLFDSINEYMIAIETSRDGATNIDYYIVATDTVGNVRAQGSLAQPLSLGLLPPAVLAQSTPANTAPATTPAPASGPRGWIIGAAALLVVAVLVGGGGGSSSSAGSGDTVPLTIFSPTPNQ